MANLINKTAKNAVRYADSGVKFKLTNKRHGEAITVSGKGIVPEDYTTEEIYKALIANAGEVTVGTSVETEMGHKASLTHKLAGSLEEKKMTLIGAIGSDRDYTNAMTFFDNLDNERKREAERIAARTQQAATGGLPGNANGANLPLPLPTAPPTNGTSDTFVVANTDGTYDVVKDHVPDPATTTRTSLYVREDDNGKLVKTTASAKGAKKVYLANTVIA